MKEGSKRFFYLNSLSPGKNLIYQSVFFILIAFGSEKTGYLVGMSGWGISIFKWGFIVAAILTIPAGIFYITNHNTLPIAKIDDTGMTCFWGPVWNRKLVEVPWHGVRDAYVSMVHKKRMVFVWYGPYTDMGNDEEVLKILLTEPEPAALAVQIQTLNNRFWRDATVEANKEGTE